MLLTSRSDRPRGSCLCPHHVRKGRRWCAFRLPGIKRTGEAATQQSEAVLNIRKTRTGEVLEVHPHYLMYFVDETGHEDFADPNFPVFGMGGCGLLAAALEQNLRGPWRKMKDRHFSGADAPMHASDLQAPSHEQLTALNEFFEQQTFGRFAVTMTHKTELPSDIKPIQVMPGLLRRRWVELTPRFVPLPIEVGFIHEASERGDELLEKYFGPSIVTIDGKQVKVHHGIMPKGDEALEVADFVVQAAGGQARHGLKPGRPVRRDFEAVFRAKPLWSSFFAC
jgi:hypothetical protein